MSYSIDEINISNKIFYYLLKNGELKDSEHDLYKSYCENENITELVKNIGEASEVYIKKYGGVVYLIPKEENDFLGYSKVNLRKLYVNQVPMTRIIIFHSLLF